MGPRPEKARPARGRHTSAMDAALCTVAESHRAQDRGRPSPVYSGSYDPWEVHKGEAAAAKRRAEVGRQMRAELAELEAWFVDHGHLDKKWWDQFN